MEYKKAALGKCGVIKRTVQSLSGKLFRFVKYLNNVNRCTVLGPYSLPQSAQMSHIFV